MYEVLTAGEEVLCTPRLSVQEGHESSFLPRTVLPITTPSVCGQDSSKSIFRLPVCLCVCDFSVSFRNKLLCLLLDPQCQNNVFTQNTHSISLTKRLNCKYCQSASYECSIIEALSQISNKMIQLNKINSGLVQVMPLGDIQ